MKCPFCGCENMEGIDECESCFENLSSLDGVRPKTKFEKVLMRDPITKVGLRAMTVVSPGSSTLDAIHKMNAEKVGAVLVGDKNQIEGILTERDILFKAMGQDLAKLRVRDVMTPHPVTLEEDDTIAFALHQMSVMGFRHLPILRDSQPVGIVSVRDVLRYIGQIFP